MAATRKRPPAASFKGLRAASTKSSRIASRASRKQGTRCEEVLCEALRQLGLMPALHVRSLPGCPDLVFPAELIVVFVDGDFWHGRRLAQRLERLSRGQNSSYWVSKIRSNVARDQRVRRQLRAQGWRVIRIWEGDVHSHLTRATGRIVKALQERATLKAD